MMFRLATFLLSLTSVLFFLLSSSLDAADILETWESQALTNPFTGSGDLTWTGDLSDFEITSATWPSGAGQPPDFAGSRSLRSLDTNVGQDSTTVVTAFSFTDLSSGLNTGIWRAYVSGNSADISTVRDFSLLLTSDTSTTSDIEAGTMNGYRLFIGDDPGAGGSADVAQLQVATGAGWSSISSESISAGANVNESWQLEAQFNANLDVWSWGFENGVAIDSLVTLNNTVADASVTSGSVTGMIWRSSDTDDNNFGFDNFSVSVVPEPGALQLAVVALVAGSGFRRSRRRRRRYIVQLVVGRKGFA